MTQYYQPHLAALERVTTTMMMPRMSYSPKHLAAKLSTALAAIGSDRDL
jgi:hypothetical protein